MAFDFNAALKKARAEHKSNRGSGRGRGRGRGPQIPYGYDAVGMDITAMGLVIRGCSRQEVQGWIQGAHPGQGDAYTLSKDYYASEAQWMDALRASIAFMQALGCECVVVLKNCRTIGTDTYRSRVGHRTVNTMRKINGVSGEARLVSWADLNAEDDVAELICAVISNREILQA